MQPVRQQTHGVAAGQAQKAPDPNHDPGLNNPTDLPGVHAVSDNLQNPFRAMGSLSADEAKLRANILQRRSIRAFGAELLDSSNQAM
jgi:hypothetical protein